MWSRKTLALGAALGALAVFLSPATVSRARPTYPTSFCLLGDEAWELAKLHGEHTNTSLAVLMPAPILLTATSIYSVEAYDPYQSRLWESIGTPFFTSGKELRPFLPRLFSKWVLTNSEGGNTMDYKSQAVALGKPTLLTNTDFHALQVYAPFQSRMWGSMTVPFLTSGEEFRLFLTDNNENWAEAYNLALLSLWHTEVASPSIPTASKNLPPLGLAARLTKIVVTVAATGRDLLAKWERAKNVMEKRLLPPGSPQPCEGYWESFVLMCIISICGTSYVGVEIHRTRRRVEKEDDPEALVDTTLGAELDRSAQGVAAVPPHWSATEALKRQEEMAKKAFIAGVKRSLLELTILCLMGLAFLGTVAALYCIGKWGVGAIVTVALLVRNEEGEQGVEAVIDFVNSTNADNKRKQRKQRAHRRTFLARTCLAPMLGDYEEVMFVDTFMAKRWGRMGNDELIQDKGLVGSILAGLLSQEAAGAAAGSPCYSTVFEKLGETVVGTSLAEEAEGAEAVASFTVFKVIKQRWTLARILGITLPARRQRQASASSSPLVPARAPSQSGGDDRFRSESVLPRGAPSSSINVDGAGVVVGEAWSVEGKENVAGSKSGSFRATLKRVFSIKSRSPASSRASATSLCVE